MSKQSAEPGTAQPPLDDDIQQILDQAEAGIIDAVVSYERIEGIYMAAVMASAPALPTTSYSTHT